MPFCLYEVQEQHRLTSVDKNQKVVVSKQRNCLERDMRKYSTALEIFSIMIRTMVAWVQHFSDIIQTVYSKSMNLLYVN